MEYREITNIVLCLSAVIILGIIFYKHIKTPEAERSVENIIRHSLQSLNKG